MSEGGGAGGGGQKGKETRPLKGAQIYHKLDKCKLK